MELCVVCIWMHLLYAFVLFVFYVFVAESFENAFRHQFYGTVAVALVRYAAMRLYMSTETRGQVRFRFRFFQLEDAWTSPVLRLRFFF